MKVYNVAKPLKLLPTTICQPADLPNHRIAEIKHKFATAAIGLLLTVDNNHLAFTIYSAVYIIRISSGSVVFHRVTVYTLAHNIN
jgi:hypothetical protein